MKNYTVYASVILMCVVFNVSEQNAASFPKNIQQKEKKFKEKCWSKNGRDTLLGKMETIIEAPLEIIYQNDDYIQTFGCAYEDDDIEQNSIRAVFRAIDQSLRNRRVTARDNILGLLRSRPPRPDNLARDYTVYVNLVINSEIQLARYEIKVLDLDVVPTFESRRAVWTRIITRYAYQKDFKNAPRPSNAPSEFVKVMELAEAILEALWAPILAFSGTPHH